jgi:hypothetical protein
VEKLRARQSVLQGQPAAAGEEKGGEQLVDDPEAVDSVLNCSIVKLAVQVSLLLHRKFDPRNCF